MRLQTIIFPVALSAITPALYAQGSGKKVQDQRPNIIYMMADDYALNAVSIYNSRLANIALTPNLDRIGEEGMVLINCFSTNSVSTPNCACILTGKLSHKNGVLDLAASIDSTAQVIYPQLLQEAGYNTGMFGKWHLHAMSYCFNEWKVMVGQGNYHNPYYWEKGIGWKKNNKGAKQYEGYVTDITTTMAIDFLDHRMKDKPFALILHFKAPHNPFDYNKKYEEYLFDVEIPEPYNFFDEYATRGRGVRECTQHIGDCHTLYTEETGNIESAARKKAQYQIYMKRYLRCIASIDENVGRVLEYLDRNGLSKNTIVIYISDQGFFLREYGLYDKRFMYEESIRMPFLVRYPAAIKSGSRNDELIASIDFCPTFLDYAGVIIPEEVQGESLRPIFEGKKVKWKDASYYRYWMHGAHLAMDSGEMKNGYDDPANWKSIKKPKKKLVDLRKYYEDTDESYPEMQEIMKNYWNN